MNTQQILIKNNTDKEYNDLSILNINSLIESGLEFSLPNLEDGTPFLDFLADLKEPKEVSILRYQYHCEDSNNSKKQLACDFTIKYGENIKTRSFSSLRPNEQQQIEIVDVIGERVGLKLSNDLDFVLEKILPKTVVTFTFYFEPYFETSNK